MVEVASDVCDNLWPDDGTEPWPLCPEHRDHRSCEDRRRDGLPGALGERYDDRADGDCDEEGSLVEDPPEERTIDGVKMFCCQRRWPGWPA